MRLAASGELVGGCELRLQNDAPANLSYWTFPHHRQRGLIIEPDNAASRGVARDAGFTEAGATQASPGAGSEPRTMLRYLRSRDHQG